MVMPYKRCHSCKRYQGCHNPWFCIIACKVDADMLCLLPCPAESKRKAIEKEPEEFMAPTEVPGNVARSDQDMRINVQPRVV